jgi:hypothetical protein
MRRGEWWGAVLVVVVASALAFAGTALPGEPAVAAALRVGDRFVDDNGNIHEGNIEAIAVAGVTKGCNPPTNDRYCPADRVPRGQMAAFLNWALHLPATGKDFFSDDGGSTFEADINRLAAAGITKGCNPPANDRYCPDTDVTRGQMAAFLVRAFGYGTGGGSDLFVDDDGTTFERDIDRLGTAGVTKGCNPPRNDRFCPRDKVRRDQMASFLTRALELAPWPTPPERSPNVTVRASGSGLRASWGAVGDADRYDVEYRISVPSTSEIPDERVSLMIVGGANASIHQFPWQVALLDASIANSHAAQFCGGSLVAPDWVLTAAHCVAGFPAPDVGYGESKLSDMGSANRIGVAQIVVHPLWSFTALGPGDVALLRLEQPVPGGRPIALSGQVAGLGRKTWASGWGSTDPWASTSLGPDTIQSIQLQVLAGPTATSCGKWGPTVFNGAHHVCAGISLEWGGPCVGDSGGPLATVFNRRWHLAGVTSFGSSPLAAGCSHPELPSLFSRVSNYSTWVASYAPETDWVKVGSTTATAKTIPSLVPGYRYDVRVRGTNDAGAGRWSAVTTGLVAGSVAPPAP